MRLASSPAGWSAPARPLGVWLPTRGYGPGPAAGRVRAPRRPLVPSSPPSAEVCASVTEPDFREGPSRWRWAWEGGASPQGSCRAGASPRGAGDGPRGCPEGPSRGPRWPGHGQGGHGRRQRSGPGRGALRPGGRRLRVHSTCGACHRKGPRQVPADPMSAASTAPAPPSVPRGPSCPTPTARPMASKDRGPSCDTPCPHCSRKSTEERQAPPGASLSWGMLGDGGCTHHCLPASRWPWGLAPHFSAPWG